MQIVSRSAWTLYNLLCALVRYSQRNGRNYAYPSLKWLATKLDRSTRTVQRCLKELEKEGLIEIRRCGARRNNMYFVRQDVRQEQRRASDARKRQERQRDDAKMSYQNNNKKHRKQDTYINRMSNNVAGQRLTDFNGLKKEIKRNYALSLTLRDDGLMQEVRSVTEILKMMMRTAAQNRRIAVNGARISVDQWAKYACKCDYNSLAAMIYKLSEYKVRNLRSYILASAYNCGVEKMIFQPYGNEFCV